MWLVLGAAMDPSLSWAAQGLKTLGVDPLEVITDDDLAHLQCWEHRIDKAGVHTRLILADGRMICSDGLNGVLNRLVCAPSEPLLSAHPDDRLYATQEFTALYLSWLYSLPGPMLNRPTPQSLCGAWRHPTEWAWLAAGAGLSIRHNSQTSCDSGAVQDWPHSMFRLSTTQAQTVFVVDNQIVDLSVPPSIGAACRRLAQRADTALLGIDVVQDSEGRWNFLSATPYPDLRRGGDPLLDALANALCMQEVAA